MHKTDNKQIEKTSDFPPVVSVLGHVDHGKTTLLDTIRKTNIVGREKGGITQKIGASVTEVNYEGKKRKITFIDTPGHEAFANMRMQGVSAADIVLLLVSAVDGVMPQTKESISKILTAGIPFIVVITKVDLETANVEKVKQQLLSENVLLEGLGGDIPYIAVSSKTGERIEELLDLILLVYDLSAIQKTEKEEFIGIVIEAKLDQRKGSLASVVVKSGKLQVQEKIYTKNGEVGKARALINTFGQNVKVALPGEAIEIIGLKEVLKTGSIVYNSQEKVEKTKNAYKAFEKPVAFDLAKFLHPEEQKKLRIVLKTDTKGEIEAIRNTLPKDIEIAFEAQGEIGVADVLLAKDLGAIIIGFNNNITKEARDLASSEHVFFKIYNIIYELLEEIQDAATDLSLQGSETVLGKAKILAVFESNKKKVMGVKVNEGRLAINDKIRVLRDEKEIGKAKIVSLRRGKTEVKEVAKGLECGVLTSPSVDFIIGDMLSSYSVRR